MKICATCGRPIIYGCYTDDEGSFYTHVESDLGYEHCFETYMDRTYGKHRWMELGNGEQDEYGGFYIHTANIVGGNEGTGVYYTEFSEKEIMED